MKQYTVFVQMANSRYCHDIVTANGDSPEQIKNAEDKAVSLANEILSRYQGEGVYCFVDIYDENYTIIYEKDNIATAEDKGDKISIDTIGKGHDCSCRLAEGFTKEGDKKFISMCAELDNSNIKTYFLVYCCDKAMISTIKKTRTRNLNYAIKLFNKL